MRFLKWIVNSDMREYFIEKVNAPLVKAIVILGGRYPKPTHDNVLHPNTHILIDLRDEFFKVWDTRRSERLFEALWRILIVKYEHSPGWQFMFDWVIMMVQKSNWKPFDFDRQMRNWRGKK